MNTKQLKDKILAMAMRGELVEQDPTDESAEVLLEKIKEEKTKLIAEKKIKKEKPLAEVEEDEIPYDLPQGWVWIRLGEIAEILSGFAYKSNKFLKSGEYQVLRLGNVKNYNLNLTTQPVYISQEYAEETSKSKCLENDILVTMTGTRNKRDYFYTCIVQENDKYFFNQRVGCIRCNLSDLVVFLSYSLKETSLLSRIFLEETGTVNQGNLGVVAIKNLLIPLPPLAEQKRIVEKIETLFAEVDKLEESRENLDGLKGKLDKKLLDMAMRGELVEQDPTDESAETLLEIIKEEKAKLIAEKKIKKEKPLTPIEEDEIPYDLPQGWVWTRLGEVLRIDNPAKEEGEFPYWDVKTLRGTKEIETKVTGRFVNSDDKVILVDGENSGEIFIIPNDGYMGSTFKKIYIYNDEYWQYLTIVIESYRAYLKANKVGSAIPHLNKEIFKNLLLPLPPLEEQKRIVEKLETVRKIINESL